MRVGACQTREILGDVDAAVRAVHGFAAQTDASGVDLLLFPECFLQGYVVTRDHVHEHALEVGSARFATVLTHLASIRPMLVLGMIEHERNRYYNTALVINGGRVVGAYRKTHLTGGESVFTPGNAYPIFDCGSLRFGINICSDTQSPSAAAAVAAGGAQVLLVPAQNMMRRDKALWWQERHNQIRVQRVLETRLWLVSADVTGDRDGTHLGLGPTCAINPDGQVVTQVPAGMTGMAVAEITGQRPPPDRLRAITQGTRRPAALTSRRVPHHDGQPAEPVPSAPAVNPRKRLPGPKACRPR